MMNRPNLMYKQGGLNDEGGEIDEVSGNRVPVGGTKKGVRDDIEVNMSAGEWVADEATTRYHGLKTFLGMRDEALMGMKKMEAMGLMGNSDEATLPDDMPFGMADLLIVEVDEKNGKERELNMQDGGFVSGQEGETISLEGQQQTTPVRQRRKVTFDEVMSEAKMEFKEYRNAEGQSLMVPFIGGVPLYPIPEGYTLYTGEGSETGETELPDTGAEAITPSARDDDDDNTALTAYRASKKDTSIQWDTLSDEEFLKEANARNGFGRNLAMGVASLISPFAAVGMSALMRVEDNKVLAMARTRLANLPEGSAQRAQYEKMIEAYEARGKGLFGGIIGKIVDILGNAFGSTEEQKKKGQNANLVGNSGLVVGTFSSNGQITQAGTDAVNSGIVNGISTEQYLNAVADLESDDPEVKKAAQNVLAKHIGQELGNFVDPNIMRAVQTGIGGRTPEQTRVDLVNIAYQPSTVLKEQLDNLTQGQKDFLGYTGENYLDVVDFGREQVSQILPTDTPRLAPSAEPMGLTDTSRSASYGARVGTALDLREPVLGMLDTSDLPERSFMTADTISDRAALSGDTSGNIITQADIRNTEAQVRQDQVDSLVNVGVDRNLAEAAVPAVGMGTVPTYTSRDVDALEGPEAAGAGTVQTVTAGQTPTELGFGDAQLGEFGGLGTQTETQPSEFVQSRTNYQETGDPLGQGTVVSTTPATEAVDRKDDPAYPEYYAERMLPSPFEAVGADGRGITTPSTTTGQTPTELGFGDAQLGEFGGLPSITTEQEQTDRGFTPTNVAQPAATATTITLPQYDSATVQEQAAATEDAYMEAAFGTPETTPDTTTEALQLADVVPDTGTTTGAAMSFDDAFAAARAEEARQGIASGTSQFEFNGQMYSTATAEEAATQTAQTQQDERQGKYDPTANTALSGGYTANTLSSAEQEAFDYAVDSGNTSVANHYAQINRLRNKQDEFAASGFDETLGRSLGLSEHDMEQAREYGGSVQTAINEGRAESGGFLQPATVIDPTPTTSTGGRDDDRGSTTTTTTTTSRSDDRDNNVASSGRTETQIQADINSALEASGGEWTSELNDLVSERDSARANEGTSTTTTRSSSNDDGGNDTSPSNDSSCVIATHGISTGGFSLMEKAKAEIWCERTYHGKWYGEAFRRGYRHLGKKAIEKGKAAEHYQEFKDFVSTGRGLKKDWKSKINYYKRTIQFFLTGLFVKEDV